MLIRVRQRQFSPEWERFGAGVLIGVIGPVAATLLTTQIDWLQGHGEFSLFVVAVAVTSAFGTVPAVMSALLSVALIRTIVDTDMTLEPAKSELIASFSLVFVAGAVSQLVDRTRRARARLEEMNASLASNELLLRELVDEATASRESLEVALEGGRMIAWESNPETGQLMFSPGFAAIHGRPVDGFDTLDSYRQLIHPDDRAKATAALAASARDTAIDDFRVRFRIVRPDGSERWLEDRGRYERGADGRVVRSFGVAVDVTEQVEAAQRVEEAELRYRTLIERLPLTVYSTDASTGEATYFSPQIEELTGFTSEEILANGGLSFWRTLIIDEDRQENVAAFEGFIGHTDSTYYREYRIRHRNGEIRWVSSAAQFLSDPDGTATHVQGFLLDITKRRAASAELEAAEARYRTLVEQLPLATFVGDVDTGEFVYMSPQVELLLGLTQDEFLRIPAPDFWRSLTHPDDREIIDEANRRIARGDRSPIHLNRYRIRHKDGHWVWVSSAAQVVDGPAGGRQIQGFILDISGQVAAEEIFRTVFDESPLGIMVADIGHDEGGRRIVQVNDEYCRIVGRTAEELIGTMSTDLVHPDDQTDRLESTRELLAGKRESFQDEWRYLRPDGSEVMVRGSTSLLGWVDAATARTVMMVENVTKERRAQQERTEIERQYRTLIERLPLVTYVNLANRTRGFVSPQLAAITGYDEEEIETRGGFIDLIHPDDWTQVKAETEAAEASGVPFHVEYRVRTKDGRWLWLRDEQVPITDDAGELLYSLGFLIDITHSKEVEHDLATALDTARAARDLAERTLAEINTLVETSPVALALLDREGRYVQVSSSLAELNGVPAVDHVGRHYSEIVDPKTADAVSGKIEAALAGERVSGDLEFETPHGVRKLHIRYFPILRGSEVIGASVALVDMTEQRALEQRMQQSHQLEALGRLAGGIAHDFNNILTSVQICVDMILDQVDDSQVRAEAEAARNASVHGAELVKQLLAFGRQQVMQPHPINLNATLSGFQRMLGNLAAAEEIELVYDLDPAEPWIVADSSQIGQVALNLAVNARDAMMSGGTLTVATRLRERPNGHMSVQLQVTDTGTGMSEAVKARLFEPFFTTKREGEGTGLGLATVYGIVSQTGGEITVESSEGRGSTFTITWPVAPSGQDAAAPEPAPATEPMADMTKPVVLLVEDEDGVRLLVSSLLAKRGFAVIEATDGVDALDRAADHPQLGLLLTDVRMPRMGGGELAERLRETRPDLPVIFISGQSDDERVRDRLGEDHVAFLPKPFGADEVEQVIRFVLDS